MSITGPQDPRLAASENLNAAIEKADKNLIPAAQLLIDLSTAQALLSIAYSLEKIARKIDTGLTHR